MTSEKLAEIANKIDLGRRVYDGRFLAVPGLTTKVPAMSKRSTATSKDEIL